MGVFIPYGKGKLRFMDRVFEKGFFIIRRPNCRSWSNEQAIFVGEIQTGSNRGDHLFEFCIEDEHPGTTISNNKFEFRSGESPVKGDQDCTDLRKGEEDFEVLMAVVKENGNSIPLLNSYPQKKMAELIDAQVDFLTGKGTVFKDQDSLVRLKKTPFLYPFTDVDHSE
jgi:hypothetical protein